jgi:hypothetical protein
MPTPAAVIAREVLLPHRDEHLVTPAGTADAVLPLVDSARRAPGSWKSRDALQTSWPSRHSRHMLRAMEQKLTRDAVSVRPAGASRAETTGGQDAPTSTTTGRGSGAVTGPALGDVPDARPAPPAHAFGSVICASDRTSIDDEARRQAARLVSPGGVIELVAASRLTRRGKRALRDRCDGYDLLALGACAEACTAAANAPIPTLIARRCAPGIEVTDTIVVAVDDSPESSRAAELAGRLAAEHGGTATILATPPLDRALARAIAASFRILWRATGAAPRVIGEPRPPEQRFLPQP